jgi:dTDP-4-amino-4,6-dideoxygalactose transaminase
MHEDLKKLERLKESLTSRSSLADRLVRAISVKSDQDEIDLVSVLDTDSIPSFLNFNKVTLIDLAETKRALGFWVVDYSFNKLGIVIVSLDQDCNFYLTCIFPSESNLEIAKQINLQLGTFLSLELEIDSLLLRNIFTEKIRDLSLSQNLELFFDGPEFTVPSHIEETGIEEPECLNFRDLPKKNGQILTAGPSISPLEIAYVNDAVKFGWNEKNSNYLDRFEQVFAEFVGAKFAMATSSCTGGLHLSLLALGIGAGDEVLVPDITWVATASAVMYVGAKPIFVDIEKDTWTMNIAHAESLINQRTKAIIPVHLYGFGANMPQIVKLAKKNNLYIVEDAAPAIGTKISNQSAGTFGDFGCYSFQGAKLLVTGEGGMVVTNNEDLYKKIRKLQDHGRRPGTFWIEELGYKYKMNNITAALGLAQIQRAEQQISKKREINKWYRENLQSLNGIEFQIEEKMTSSIFWMTSFTLDENLKISRDQLMEQLKIRGIDSRPVFPSISQYKIWGYDSEVPNNSKLVGDNGINLPSGVSLNKQTVSFISESIIEILNLAL